MLARLIPTLPRPTLLVGLLVALAACSSDNNPPAIGIADDPTVSENSALPGVVVTIEDVRGAGGSGRGRVGDRLVVDFTVKTDAGAPLELSRLTRAAIMVSGPTFNYQRVIASQSDVIARSVKRGLGAYSYTFEIPVPAVYEAPLNDTTALTEGELTGQALLAGTYTVGMELRKDYTVGGETYRDPGNASFDFLLGGASTLEPREVVTLANCNQCHGELRAHGDNRNNLTNCLLCHTAGAEDRNTATVANGTPGVTIDFKVMIHKIHSGQHLPSVNGVTTNPDGTRKYDAVPQPYEIIGFGNNVIDFSEVAFPNWPSLAYPMPRDLGYGGLTSTEQGLENTMRGAPVDCRKCHGDPDGSGPLAAPAQGELAFSQPSTAACGSCHDDWVPEYPYTANGQTMPGDRDNSTCKECHRPDTGDLNVRDSHIHPLVDPTIAEGLIFDITSVTPSNGTTFDAGEKVQVTMTIKDASGANVPASSMTRIEAVLNGPTSNPNLLHYVRLPQATLGSAATYTFNLPEYVYLEAVGSSDGGVNGETWATARAPHWAGQTAVLLATTATGSSTLAAGARVAQNYVDLATGGGSAFANNDYILIDAGTPGVAEYMRVEFVDGDRLWFSSPYSATGVTSHKVSLTKAHVANATVDKVSLATVATSKYSLDALTGIVTETTEFGAGAVIVSYLTDYEIPSVYPATFNDSPDLGEDWGKWAGLSVLPGTYNLGIWGRRTVTASVSFGGDTQTTDYNEASDPEVVQLLFGSATEVENVARIDGPETCNACHTDIQFHGGGRRGVETCFLCHTNAGAEDSARYSWTNPGSTSGVDTTGVTIDFRTMLHKIHHGKELTAGASYQVAGFGGNPTSFEHVGFPYFPGMTQNCTACHGTVTEAWVEPADRNHPDAILPTRTWRAACNTCHDSSPATAHIDANTSIFGAEACAICHGVGKDVDVRSAHTVK